MRSAISMLRSAGYSTLPEVIDDSMPFEFIIQSISKEYRRVSRLMGEELLNGMR